MQINRRSVMLMAWVYARQGAARFGGSPRLYLSASLKQAWAEEKADATQAAARGARLASRRARNVQLDMLEQERLELLAGRTVPYSWARGVRTGRFQGGRW